MGKLPRGNLNDTQNKVPKVEENKPGLKGEIINAKSPDSISSISLNL